MWSRTTYYWIFLILVICVVTEGASLLSLSVLKHYRGAAYLPADRLTKDQIRAIEDILHNRTDYTVYSSDLGWTVKPGGTSTLYRANSQGLRADREYGLLPPPGAFRISSFGDSFTHCHDVDNRNSWQEIMMELSPGLEVLNFGVGAYGLDQALLRYRQDGLGFKSHIILIGFMSDCLSRNVNVFRPFLNPRAGIALAKPRFALEGEELVLLPAPVSNLEQYGELLTDATEALSKIGRNDHHYGVRYKSGPFDFLSTVRLLKMTLGSINRRYRGGILDGGQYDEASEAYLVTVAILDAFRADVLDNDSLPVIVIFPTREDVVCFSTNGHRKYQPLLSHLDNRGYEYIDLIDALAGAGGRVGDLVAEHYTPLANRLVARAVLDYLKENELTDPRAVESRIAGIKDRPMKWLND